MAVVEEPALLESTVSLGPQTPLNALKPGRLVSRDLGVSAWDYGLMWLGVGQQVRDFGILVHLEVL